MKLTMRTIITICFTLALNLTFGQKAIFKTSYFENNQLLNKTKIDTLELTDHIDLDFFKKHFYKPYYYPKHFINKEFKDSIVVKWNNENIDKNYKSNWTFTFEYDSLSRVTRYEYSGCFICSQLPFKLFIHYDKLNRPILFVNELFINSHNNITEKVDLETNQSEPYETFEFIYNLTGDIILVKVYRLGLLVEQIEKI